MNPALVYPTGTQYTSVYCTYICSVCTYIKHCQDFQMCTLTYYERKQILAARLDYCVVQPKKDHLAEKAPTNTNTNRGPSPPDDSYVCILHYYVQHHAPRLHKIWHQVM